MRIANLTFRLLGGALCSVALCTAQNTVPEESVVAKLDAAITPSGALQATAVFTATGTRSIWYLDAFKQGGSGIGSPGLFGHFLQTRKLASAPVLTRVSIPEPGIQIRIPILEDDFLLPIQRRQPLHLELLPLGVPLAERPDERINLGPLKTFREEIRFKIPTDFAVQAKSYLNEERPFARYKSDAKIEGGILIIVRELRLKQDTLGGENKDEIESFFKTIREDQQHPFILRRTSAESLTDWIQSVPPLDANKYGLRAYEQREYESARRLFEKAVEATPEHPTAWDNLGRALAALGKLDEARKAYQKQLVVNPKHPSVYNDLARVQERQHQWDSAIQSRRKQLEIKPDDLSALSNLPRLLLKAGRWTEAEQAASQAVQALPKNTPQRLDVSLARLDESLARVCGDKAPDARQEIDQALGPNPGAVLLNEAAYHLGECNKQIDLAVSYARRSLDLTMKSQVASARNGTMLDAIRAQNSLSSHLDTYGWLLFNQGKLEQAMDMLSTAVAFAPRSEVYAHLAQAESKAGHGEQECAYWREATLLEPGQLSQVPPAIAARLDSIAPLSVDRVWYRLKLALADDLAGALKTGQPSYFFVAANADGSLHSARQLDSEDPAAKIILPILSGLTLPVVQIEGNPQPTVYFVKVVKGSDGRVMVARSLSAEAAAIATELAPNEFPSSAAAAAGQQRGGTYTIGGGVSAPSLLHKIEPQYAEEARHARLQGTVALAIVVGADGKAHDLKVVRSLGLGLDEEAIAAVSEWLFRPGVKEGKPVNVQAKIQVNFRLLETEPTGVTSLARADFHTPLGATRPFVDKSVFPRHSAAAENATMTVTFDVDEKGNTGNIRVERASDDMWASEVTAALSKWRFIPGSKDGIALSISCTMGFVRGPVK